MTNSRCKLNLTSAHALHVGRIEGTKIVNSVRNSVHWSAVAAEARWKAKRPSP